MKKYSRLAFIGLAAFLSLIAGMFADESVAYTANFLPQPANSYLGILLLTIGVICLALGAIIIFRLIGSHIDSIQTRIWLIIGSVLTGLAVGWVVRGILVMMNP